MGHFFITFTRKLTEILIFTLISSILGGLTENYKRCLIFHYKNKNIYNFYAFTKKIDFRNMSKSREFRWENKANPSPVAYFVTFFSKNFCISRKEAKAYRFFIAKISVLTNFKNSRIKVPLAICQGVESLDLRTVLCPFMIVKTQES